MIRISTLAWVGLVAVAGFGVFQLKHEVQALEDEMFRLNRAVLAEQKAIHVLRAEWSYMNRPERLQSLAARHLDLQPVQPGKIVALADLPVRNADTMLATAPGAKPSASGAAADAVTKSASATRRAARMPTMQAAPVSAPYRAQPQR